MSHHNIYIHIKYVMIIDCFDSFLHLDNMVGNELFDYIYIDKSRSSEP